MHCSVLVRKAAGNDTVRLLVMPPSRKDTARLLAMPPKVLLSFASSCAVDKLVNLN